eukprot:g1750.t1
METKMVRRPLTPSRIASRGLMGMIKKGTSTTQHHSIVKKERSTSQEKTEVYNLDKERDTIIASSRHCEELRNELFQKLEIVKNVASKRVEVHAVIKDTRLQMKASEEELVIALRTVGLRPGQENGLVALVEDISRAMEKQSVALIKSQKLLRREASALREEYDAKLKLELAIQNIELQRKVAQVKEEKEVKVKEHALKLAKVKRKHEKRCQQLQQSHLETTEKAIRRVEEEFEKRAGKRAIAHDKALKERDQKIRSDLESLFSSRTKETVERLEAEYRKTLKGAERRVASYRSAANESEEVKKKLSQELAEERRLRKEAELACKRLELANANERDKSAGYKKEIHVLRGRYEASAMAAKKSAQQVREVESIARSQTKELSEAHKEEVKKLKDSRVEEMEEIDERIRSAMSKKEEIIVRLRKELKVTQKRLTEFEEMLSEDIELEERVPSERQHASSGRAGFMRKLLVERKLYPPPAP